MKTRDIDVFLYVGVLLFSLEVGLEYRAAGHGWNTLLFRPPASPRVSNADARPVRVDFSTTPPSSLDTRLATKVWVASASHAVDGRLGTEACFPAQIGRTLAESGVVCKILNASRAGCSIANNTADLALFGAEHAPDFVVLYQMSIDMVDLSGRFLSDTRPLRRSNVSPGASDAPSGVPSGMEQLVGDTTLYTLIKTNLTPWFSAHRLLATELGENAEQEFTRTLDRFIRAARSCGATPVLCTFATSHSQDDFGGLPWEVRRFMLKYNMYLSPQGWRRAIVRFNAIIREKARSEGIPLVDCDAALTGRADCFVDYVHFTRAGHALVAQLATDQAGTQLGEIRFVFNIFSAPRRRSDCASG